jgi:group I intron endonuclease
MNQSQPVLASTLVSGTVWRGSVPEAPGVYRIFCAATGECYVGGTNNLLRRSGDHAAKLSRGISTYRLRGALERYPRSLRFEVLERCELSELREREAFWVEKLNPAFNTRPVTAKA